MIGCAYYQVEKEEFINEEKKLDIKVITQDSKEYYFDAGKYFVENDTIKGLCRKWTDYNYEYEKVKIPLEEIKEYEIENKAQLPIFLVFIGTLVVISFLFILEGLTHK